MKNNINEESLNFIKSLETLLKNDEGFAEEYLSSNGYDPNVVAIEFESFAQKLVLQKKAELAKQKLISKLERAKTIFNEIVSSADESIGKLQELLNPELTKKYSLNFRDLKEMKESEAMKILTDIEILEILEKEYGNDDTKNKS
ncbi:hypothetical protein [Negadavirga shengliensis]|uniref:Uncharacterized protein n=1 Tax=Negadavirga shengliensis TaxID=1389218 RepID=A0ABV9T6X6_9BACT